MNIKTEYGKEGAPNRSEHGAGMVSPKIEQVGCVDLNKLTSTLLSKLLSLK